MCKIKQVGSIPNSCSLSCNMKDCISLWFLYNCGESVHKRWRYKLHAVLYICWDIETTVLKLSHWLEKQWELKAPPSLV